MKSQLAVGEEVAGCRHGTRAETCVRCWGGALGDSRGDHLGLPRPGALTPGLKDIGDSLQEQLGSLGVTSFGEVGDLFDPACHDALTHHVVPAADRLVCSAVLRPGYRLGENVLRPATVEVTGPAPPVRSASTPGCGVRDASAPAGKPPLPASRS
ncbi:nucleotide exchange factor GrpE [Streptomyces sp. NPDC001135]